MLSEMAALGFTHAELSHGIRITLVPGILRAVAEGVIRITSTHNFCPLPTGVVQAAPNLFQPSARDRREHDQWLRHTRRSIEFAAQVGAKALVLHLGSVEFFWFNPARQLGQYLRDHPDAGRNPGDQTYAGILRACCERLERRQPPFWAQVQESLREISDLAREKGIRLGCENREKFEELPLDAVFPAFFGAQPAGSPLGYWHDTGHADIKEGMGLLRHREHLAAMAPWTIGWHLHDVDAQGRDHQALGAGHIDFGMVSEFWRPEHLLTLEFSPRVSPDEIRASKARVEALLARRG